MLLINIYCFMVFDNSQFFVDLQLVVTNLFLSQRVVMGLEKLFTHIWLGHYSIRKNSSWMDGSSIVVMMGNGSCRIGLVFMETHMVYPHTHFIGGQFPHTTHELPFKTRMMFLKIAQSMVKIGFQNYYHFFATKKYS